MGDSSPWRRGLVGCAQVQGQTSGAAPSLGGPLHPGLGSRGRGGGTFPPLRGWRRPPAECRRLRKRKDGLSLAVSRCCSYADAQSGAFLWARGTSGATRGGGGGGAESQGRAGRAGRVTRCVRERCAEAMVGGGVSVRERAPGAPPRRCAQLRDGGYSWTSAAREARGPGTGSAAVRQCLGRGTGDGDPGVGVGGA